MMKHAPSAASAQSQAITEVLLREMADLSVETVMGPFPASSG
jgi:hypothetical protein